ncbi:hypothetical protein L4D00_23855 [Photobacterium swingsii]|uniref:hypothetical protein n=1 Tax=Photobacterium swingsii TaxID=680026 RepID=UPI003D0F1492
MLDKIESALDKFNASAAEAKSVVESSKNLTVEAKELAPVLELVDERIQKVAANLKKEVLETIDQAHSKQKQEMEARFKAERKHEKKMLLLNIGIASMAVVTFIFQRILS